MLATLMILGATPDPAAAQDATTCYAIADSNQPGNLNAEGEVDTLVRIDTALLAPSVTVVGGNGALGTGDAEAMAIRPLPDGTFQMHGWDSGLNLFTIDPVTSTTSAGPFSIPGKVEGLTWSGTDDGDADNDLLWASFGNPANQLAAYTAAGVVAAGPLTVTSGALDSLVDIAWDQTTGNVYAIITDDTDATDLIQINPADGSVTTLGMTDTDMEGLGFGRNGQLVGTTGNDGENAFHLIEKSNGVASLQADLDALTGAFDFESVDCVRDSGEPAEPPPPPPPPGDFDAICYAIADSLSAAIGDQNSPDTLVRIDALAGTATIVGQVDGGGTTSVEAFAIRPGTGLYGFDPDTGGGRLFLIDENTAAVTEIASGLGALGDVDGMTFSGVNDNDPANDVLWMSIRNAGAPNDELVTVDPNSGVILSGPLPMDASGVPGVTLNDIDAIAWDPVTGSVFGTAGSGEANTLVTINPGNGAVTPVGAFGINDIEGLGFSNTGASNGFLFGTTGKEDGDEASAFYYVDKVNPAGSVELIDLNAATGVTDFESVDCIAIGEVDPVEPDGMINATLLSECVEADGKITVNISHVSGGPVDYSVVISGEAPVLGTIAAGDPVAMVMTDATLADGDYAVQATNETTQVVVLDEVAPVVCDQPDPPVLGAAVTQTCEGGLGKITASLEYVSGEGEAVFLVSATGLPDEEVVSLAVGTEMVMYSDLADGLYNVLVTGNGEVLAAPQINVVCATAVIDVELMVNGEDADNPTGPLVPAGEQVVFKYTVTNLGTAPLTNVQVTDSTLGAIECPAAELAPGESIECMAMAAANPGQYTASATAVGTPPSGPNVLDEDPGNYFGTQASITIIKTVNGEEATTPPGPTVMVGSDVVFEYIVSNDGNLPLNGVEVNDSVAGLIACPMDILEVGASMTCTFTASAEAGDQSMEATATGATADGQPVAASTTANYFGEGAEITIVTTANGTDGATVAPGSEVLIEYLVTNVGNSPLSSVEVVDDVLGIIECSQDTLLAGESVTCSALVTPEGPGVFDQTGSVSAISGGGDQVSASDPTSFVVAASVLGDTVFVDLNSNGSQDAGEPGVADITVNLWSSTDAGDPDAIVDTTTTSDGGTYEFQVAPDTDYFVQFLVPEGSLTAANVGDDATDSDADPTNGIAGPVSVAADAANLDVDAGVLPAALGDFVFVDSNGNGQADDGEPGVSGIVVNLWVDSDGDGQPNDQVADTTTDALGNYEFAGLDPQLSYIVQFVSDGRAFTISNIDPDDTDSDPGINGITAPYSLEFGETNSTVDAGLLNGDTGEVGGVLFIDSNGNGVADDGEGIPNVQVKLLIGDSEEATMLTDNTGAYLFTGLAISDYNVMVGTDSLPAGLIHTVDNESVNGQGSPDNMSLAQILDPGQVVLGVDFGYVLCAAVGDFVFSDLNGNGLQDSGEAGVSGLTIDLHIATADGGAGQLVATDVSDSAGAYGFTCVDAANDYVIKVSGNMGAALTSANAGDDALDSDVDPVSGVSSVIVLDPGQSNDSIDVGLVGGVASIDIETATNMQDADAPGSGPEVGIGSTVTLSYVVTNTGPIDLVNVVVNDSVLGEICQVDLLPAGEMRTCNTTITAVAGPEYSSVGSVIGDPVSNGPAVNDEDPTRHTVIEGDVPNITISVLSNGTDGAELEIGSVAVVEYVVVNTGNVPLTNIVVTDSQGLTVMCDTDMLAVDAGTLCMAQITVEAGPFNTVGSVSATAPDGTTIVSADDPTNFVGVTVVPPAPPVITGGSGSGTVPTIIGASDVSGPIVSVGPISPNFTPPNGSGAVATATPGDASALAITGANSMLLATFALTAILAGCAFVAMGRRRERFE